AEGFLFPDTYEFFADDTAYNMVHKLYAQFDAVMTDELYKKMDEKKMSLNEVITLASLIQEEAGDPANMAGVSGVFTNRLKPNSPYPKMGSDVTWYYISDFIRPYYGGEGNVPEGIEDNYYTGDDDPKSRIGLPAGPLSCPGAAAINAALNPEESDYYFFLTDLTGKYYYAVTYDEHLSNIATMKKVNATVEG
ncbi:MAG: endolytic transglycosylase MltG, partial [Oscillospiraceae bacterium]